MDNNIQLIVNIQMLEGMMTVRSLCNSFTAIIHYSQRRHKDNLWHNIIIITKKVTKNKVMVNGLLFGCCPFDQVYSNAFILIFLLYLCWPPDGQLASYKRCHDVC
ncbi:hypothetical protein CEXT_110171 [Caerostris extrusa]|uniref:Uncharacterized protein n=1 Tax=Caerostris extrusa TaxID=172846 RepID=A0AAV4RA21_CAEEX|nr:hypothetical protein CEXT_110171 [Caerostris extrusa]